MTAVALVVAAGRGRRAGGALPKQWQSIAGKTVADWTLGRLEESGLFSKLCIVLHADDMDRSFETTLPLLKVQGGETRDQSVRAGLEALTDFAPDHILIHDVARPCVPLSVLRSVCASLATSQGAAPGLEITDALWRADQGHVVGTMERSGLVRAQTPQGFDYSAILSAHRSNTATAADDVEIARRGGLSISIVPGHEDNIKITKPQDFARATAILERQRKEGSL